MKKILLLLFTVLILSCSFAQDSIVFKNLIPVHDIYGQNFHSIDLNMIESTQGGSSYPWSETAGLFRLHFMDEYFQTSDGFNSMQTAPSPYSSYTLGELRKHALVRVFEDLSILLNNGVLPNPYPNQGTNPLIPSDKFPNVRYVEIKIISSSILSGDDFGDQLFNNGLISYSSAYHQDYGTGYTFNSIWEYLNSGYDPFFSPESNIFALLPMNYQYHGYLRVNLENISPQVFNYDLATTQIGTNEYDFYSVCLREAMKMLGLNTLIGENGESRLYNSGSAGQYSPYDSFLKYHSGTNTYSILDQDLDGLPFTGFNSLISMNQLLGGCSTSNVYFDAVLVDSIPVYSDSLFFDSISTFNSFHCSNTNGYILNPSNELQYIQRSPNIKEIQALCAIGYTINDTFGTGDGWIDPSNTIIPGIVYNASDANPLSLQHLVSGMNDYRPYTANNSASTFVLDSILELTILISQLLGNDNATYISDVEVIDYWNSNNVAITSSTGSFNLLTSSDEINVFAQTGCMEHVVLKYRPVNSSNQKGNPTYVFIRNPNLLIPQCPPMLNCSDNMVCFGDLDAFNGFQIGTPNHMDWLEEYAIATYQFNPLFNSPRIDGSPNVYLGLAANPANSWPHAETMVFELKTPMVPGIEYRCEFLSRYEPDPQSLFSNPGLLRINGFENKPGCINTYTSQTEISSLNGTTNTISCSGTSATTNYINQLNINSSGWTQECFTIPDISALGYPSSEINFISLDAVPMPQDLSLIQVNDFIVSKKFEAYSEVDTDPDCVTTVTVTIHNISSCDANLMEHFITANLQPWMIQDINSDFYLSATNLIGVGTIPAGQSVFFELIFTPDPSLPYGTYPIDFTFSESICDYTDAMFTPLVDIQLTKSIALSFNTSMVLPGMIIPYEIRIDNLSNIDLFNLVLQDILPTGFELYPTGSDFQVLTFPNILISDVPINLPAFQSTVVFLNAIITADETCNTGFTNEVIVDVTLSGQNICLNYGATHDLAGMANTLSVNELVINEICLDDGSITITPIGGIPPYSISWASGQTTLQINQLSAGNYLYTLTDAAGCTYNNELVIQPGSSLTITDCHGIDPEHCLDPGMAVASWTGGTSPYIMEIFDWTSGISISSSLPIPGPSHSIPTYPGQYMIVVTDANGCSQECGPIIITNQDIGLAGYGVNPLCNSTMNGYIQLLLNLVSSPYTIEWSTGASGVDNLQGLGPGIYSVTVTDSYGCVNMMTFELESTYVGGEEFVINSLIHDDCTTPGICDGSMNVQMSIGLPVYDFVWSGIEDISGNTINDSFLSHPFPSYSIVNLCAGTYWVTITDAQGCKVYSDPIVIHGFSIESSVTSPGCGNGIGLIDITVLGGTTPYSYTWTLDGNPYAATEDVVITTDGLYCVTVTDATGLCEDNDCFYVISSGSPVLTHSLTHPLCDGDNDGSISVEATGGTSPYDFNWSTGANDLGVNSSAIIGLSPGIYTVTVTDDNGCTTLGEYQISNLFQLTINLDYILPEPCIAAPTGAIFVTITGGVPPYSYQWYDSYNNPISTTSEDLENVLHGTYTIVVTDANGCTTSKTYVIPKGEIPLTYDVKGEGCDITPSVTDHLENGFIEITPLAGVGPFTLNWFPANGTMNGLFYENLLDGSIYDVTVTDINGCTGTLDDILVCSDQKVDLTSGMNLISTYITPFNSDPNEVFQNGGAYSNTDYMLNDDNELYDPTNGANFILWTKGEGYLVKMNYAGMLHFKGQLTCPEDNLITLTPSLPPPPPDPLAPEYFGYLRTENMLLTDAINPTVLGSSIIIKEENGLIYWNNTNPPPGWTINQIGTMYPGDGYNAIPESQQSFFYPINPNPQQGTKSTSLPTRPKYKKMLDEQDLNTGRCMVLGITEQAWQKLPAPGDEIGVYTLDNRLVGRTIFSGGHSGIVINGDLFLTNKQEALIENEPFKIMHWNHQTNRLSEIIPVHWRLGDGTYNMNKVSLIDELIANDCLDLSDEQLQINLFPNPSSGEIELSLILYNDEAIRISLVNLEGKVIKELRDGMLEAGSFSFRYMLDDLSSGVYMIRIKTETYQKSVKLVVTQ